MTTTTTWEPVYGNGDAVEGFWQVYATTMESAQMQIEQRMIKRAYFPLCREWRAQGKKVKVVQDEKG